MKKYNSVYTVAITIDHDKEDGSDVTQEMLIERLCPLSVTQEMLIERLYPLLSSLIFDGPDNTIENLSLLIKK